MWWLDLEKYAEAKKLDTMKFIYLYCSSSTSLEPLAVLALGLGTAACSVGCLVSLGYMGKIPLVWSGVDLREQDMHI